MCRVTPCVLLADRAAWSPDALLPLPAFIWDHVDVVADAVRDAAEGDLELARATIARFPEAAAREWCDVHGHYSGKWRAFLIHGRHVVAPPRVGKRTPMPKRLELEVFRRDRFQCRYCGIRVVKRDFFALLSKVIGPASFPLGSLNADRHGAQFALGAQAEHVVPDCRGGATSIDNLVTSCWSCNYGKRNYLLSEVGLTDPRERPQSSIEWNGLEAFRLPLQRMPTSL